MKWQFLCLTLHSGNTVIRLICSQNLTCIFRRLFFVSKHDPSSSWNWNWKSQTNDIWHGKRTWFAGAIPEKFPSVDIPTGCGTLEPTITGSVLCIWNFWVLHLPKPWEIMLSGGFDAWIKANPQLESQAYNEILKCPNCGKPCAGGPICSRTQPWTMWNWHCFILFIIDHWWLPFKAVTMTLWCLVCV